MSHEKKCFVFKIYIPYDMIVKEKNYTDRQRTHVADFIGNSSLGIFQCLKIFFSGNANSKAHVFLYV